MAFMFRLEDESGDPADPPTLKAAAPNWKAGDSIHFGRRTLRVVAVKDVDADTPPTLVVQEAAASSPAEGSERPA